MLAPHSESTSLAEPAPRVVTVAAVGWDVVCADHGRPGDPLAILLHGFPDSPATFRHLVPDLVAAGRRVIVPALPGYAPTRAAVRRPSVHPRAMADVVLAVHGAFAGDHRAVLVGHDWGAILTNQVTSTSPERFAAAVTLAVPPVTRDLLRPPDLRQLRLSWYAMVFQLPGAAGLLRRGDWAMVERLWRAWSPGYAPDEVDRKGWRGALQPDGARTAVRWYRTLVAALASGRWPTGTEQVPRVPTLHLGGNDDGCFRPQRQAAAADFLGPGSQVRMLDGLGHFLHLEDPVLVNAHITAWLAAS